MKKLMLFIVLLLPAYEALATHIVGGVINYECLGNNQYKITLRVFRDCINGQVWFDNPAYVGIYAGNNLNSPYITLQMSNPTVSQVPPIINNPCFTPPGNVCVDQAVYTATVTLPPNSSGYHLIYQRCCRNNTILNLVQPNDTGASYYAFIPGSPSITCNGNPVFTNFPPLFLCANVPFTFDHSAVDPDGDVLVYTLCNPLHGGGTSPFGTGFSSPQPMPPAPPPYNTVIWASGFSNNYPITSNPAIAINSTTGQLTLTPTQQGQFVVGVCVQEYRNGVLISTTLRDFQFNVVNCPGLVAASFSSDTTLCAGAPLQVQNTSYNAGTFHWDFGVPGTNLDVSSQQFPTYTYPVPGVYTITLVADPGSPCADTITRTVTVVGAMAPDFTPPPPQCESNNSFDFSGTANISSSAEIEWTFQSGSPGSSTQLNPTGITFPGPGSYQVTFSVTDKGCTETKQNNITVLPSPVAAIKPQADFCIGRTLTFINQSQNGNIYFWDFGDPAVDTDTTSGPTPTYTYQDTGSYTVMLISSNGVCEDTTYSTFAVKPLLTIDIGASDTVKCLENNVFSFTANGVYDTTATLLWQLGTAASISFANGNAIDSVSFDTLGIHQVTLTASDYGCTVVDQQQILLMPPPVAYFEPLRPGCVPFTITFENNSRAASPMLYLWDFGDGNTSTETNPTHTYTETGTYSVTLHAHTVKGCVDTSEYTRTNEITVHPRPEGNFTASPEEASIFDPGIRLEDKSTGHISVGYEFGDGTSAKFADGIHYYLDTGSYVIRHIAINEFGCADTSSTRIYIYPGFIPNTFSPNGDPRNEYFFPVFTSAGDYELVIFNRWGEEVFRTNQLEPGWDGSYRGRPAQQDTYVYRITAKSSNGLTYTFSGHVNLVR